MDIIRICNLAGDKKSLIERDAKVTPRVHYNKKKPLKTRISYECGQCGQMFGNRKYNMARHLERCVERAEEAKEAAKRQARYEEKPELRAQFKKKHRTKFTCVLCPPDAPKWVSLNYLEIHMESVHNIRELRRQCAPEDGVEKGKRYKNRFKHHINQDKYNKIGKYRLRKHHYLRQDISKKQNLVPQHISVIKPNPYYNPYNSIKTGVRVTDGVTEICV